MVWGNFAWRIVRGEMDLSLDLAGEAIDHAKKLEDPGVWMEALFLMGVTLYYRGDFVGARQQYETALARYDDDHERTRMWAVQGRRARRGDASLLSRSDLVAPRLSRGSAQGEPRDA